MRGAHRNDARPGGIERHGFELVARDARLDQHRPHGAHQRIHLVLMRLGGEIRVFAFTLQRVLGRRRGQPALELICLVAVEQRYPNTQRAEINPGGNRHG